MQLSVAPTKVGNLSHEREGEKTSVAARCNFRDMEEQFGMEDGGYGDSSARRIRRPRLRRLEAQFDSYVD